MAEDLDSKHKVRPMKWTRANVEEYAKRHGLEPVQVDGIPEGFSWIEPDLEIGGELHKGRGVIFEPLKETEPIYGI